MISSQAKKLASPEEYCKLFIIQDSPRKNKKENEENIQETQNGILNK